MKKKIAVLGNAWSFDFINAIISGIQEITKDIPCDIYFFTCYKFHNPDQTNNTTGYNIFNLIHFEDFDGVILLSNLFEDADSLQKVVQKIKDTKTPAVSVIKQIEGLPYVTSNNYIGFYNLITHLIEEHNIKTVGYIGGIPHDVQNETRYKAFKDAMRKHNLPINKDIVFKEGDWSFKYGYERGIQIFSMDQIPDAIICSNDTEAYGVIRAAFQKNIKIPEQVKLIGCDNDSCADATFPSLSTVDTQIKEIGKCAAQMLLEKNKSLEPVVIDTKMIIRQSCGCNLAISETQKNYAIKQLLVQDEEERFLAQQRHTEDVFINDTNIYFFWEDCQNFFHKRHTFEGNDFSIMLMKDLTKSMLFQDESFSDSTELDLLQVFINIQNGKIVTPETIQKRQLLPKNMLDNKNNNLYVFLPLVFHNNLYGYYCGKNNIKLLYNKRGYMWTKNLANSIEKFREKNKYRLLSQKYLGLSTKDALSDVYNRTALDMFAKELYETNRHSNYYTVLYFIDINDMKAINDNHGHLHGDMAIKLVADELKSIIPEKWLLIRYGGDEFVIIGSSENKEYIDILENINKGLLERGNKMSLPYKVSVSIGLSLVRPDSVNPLCDEINKVDEIMYKHKKEYHEKK